MPLYYEQKNDWIYIPAPGRWDAFNFENSKLEIEEIALKHDHIAIDVSDAQFIGIPMIRFIHNLAKGITQKGGRCVLVGSSEKLKRQIHIFASLEPFAFYSSDHWSQYVNTSLEGHV